MKSILPISGVLLGIVLAVVGFIWPLLVPAGQGWTPEKSGRLADLGSEANKLQFEIVKAKKSPNMHGGQNPAELQATFDKTMAEYDTLKAELDSARNSPASTGSALKWIGIILAAGGGLFVFANRQQG